MNPDAQQNLLANGSFIGGTYRILDFIGQGGMGHVYKVEHLMMSRIMALKLLRPEQVSDSVWQRFRNEALAIARLDHPNIVKIYDMSQTADGLPYYTMDLLVGQSLDDYLIDNDQLSVDLALPIFRQVCAGLAYAHDRGIVHRDIKPGNIMLIRDKNSNVPLIKIVDFGIAKLNTFDGVIGQGLTRPGEVMGSPLYMSPEQCSGIALDHRSDMYSVGVTMFHALTGRPPLIGKTAIETTAMHQSVMPPSMSEKDPETEYPPALEKIVARLLAKSPDHRFDSLADVARDLLALERGDGTSLDFLIDEDEVSRAAPGSHSIYEKSVVNLQSETADGITDDANNNNFFANKNILLISVTVVLIAIISIFALYFILQQRREKAVASVPEQAKLANFSTSTMAIKTLAGDDAAIGENAEVMAFLKSRPKPYAHEETMGAHKITVFQFPENFSIGEYDYNRTLIKATYPVGTAQGRVMILAGGKIKFTARECTEKYPQLLAYFRPDDVNWLVMERMAAVLPNLPENILRLKKIEYLNLKGKRLKDTDLVWISKLPELHTINIIDSEISSEGLARSSLLSRLKGLFYVSRADITTLLQALVKADRIQEIDLACADLSAADLKLIAQMKQLKRLRLNSAKVSDADLVPLTRSDKLELLNLEMCTALTKNAFLPLTKIKTLKKLKMPLESYDSEIEAVMHKALPQLAIE